MMNFGLALSGVLLLSAAGVFGIYRKRRGAVDSFDIEAVPENNDEVLRYIELKLKEKGLPQAKLEKALLASGEIFDNVASYAYAEKGLLKIEIFAKNKQIFITFQDKGKAYNPLVQKEPDLSASTEERPIGGLGIFLVKKLADSVQYERKQGFNILTIGFEKE